MLASVTMATPMPRPRATRNVPSMTCHASRHARRLTALRSAPPVKDAMATMRRSYKPRMMAIVPPDTPGTKSAAPINVPRSVTVHGR